MPQGYYNSCPRCGRAHKYNPFQPDLACGQALRAENNRLPVFRPREGFFEGFNDRVQSFERLGEGTFVRPRRVITDR